MAGKHIKVYSDHQSPSIPFCYWVLAPQYFSPPTLNLSSLWASLPFSSPNIWWSYLTLALWLSVLLVSGFPGTLCSLSFLFLFGFPTPSSHGHVQSGASQMPLSILFLIPTVNPYLGVVVSFFFFHSVHTSLLWAEILSSLRFYRSCACCHSLCDFIYASSLLCWKLENTVSLK